MGLAHCQAAGQRFSLSWAEAGDVLQVGKALQAMPRALAGKLNGALTGAEPYSVAGMTPHGEAMQFRIEGGSERARTAVFAYGTRVYQLVMLGSADAPAAWDSFAAGLQLANGALGRSSR
jgi:hypothetical protein